MVCPAGIPHAVSPTGTLHRCFATWRATPWSSHAVALGLLLVVLVARFHAAVLAPDPIEDERVYFEAFALAAAGKSPYQAAYYYTPTFALVGACAVEHLGTTVVLIALRAANLFGMAVTAWIAAAWLPWALPRRLAAAGLYLAVAPAVRLGAAWGNLSLLVVGLLLVGLLAWRTRPIAAGLLLAASLVVKPLGPVAVGTLLVHAPREGGRRQWVAGGLALALAAALVLPMPWLGDLLSFGGKPGNGRNMALQHLLYCFGLHVDGLAIAATVSLVAVVAGRRWTWTREGLLGLAGVLGVLALPVVWSHTLLLVLPLQAMALTVAFTRRREGVPTVLRRYEAAFVVVACLAIQLCEGLGGIETWPDVVQGLAASIPIFSPLGLLLFLRATGTGEDPARVVIPENRRAAAPP